MPFDLNGRRRNFPAVQLEGRIKMNDIIIQNNITDGRLNFNEVAFYMRGQLIAAIKRLPHQTDDDYNIMQRCIAGILARHADICKERYAQRVAINPPPDEI